MSKRRRLKGLSNFRFWPELENSASAYRAGAITVFPYVREIKESPIVKEEEIQADDGLYGVERDEQGQRYTLTFAEMTPDLKESLAGHELTVDGVLKVRKNDNPPAIGFGYSRLQSDGDYTMYKHYGAEVIRITDIPGTTKGQGNSSDVEVEIYVRGKLTDEGLFREEKYSTGSNLSWLDNVDSDNQLGHLTVYAIGGDVGKTKIIVASEPDTGNSFVYKTAAAVTMPDYNANLSTWTALPADGQITATNGQAVVIAEVDASKLALKAGSTVAVVTPAA